MNKLLLPLLAALVLGLPAVSQAQTAAPEAPPAIGAPDQAAAPAKAKQKKKKKKPVRKKHKKAKAQAH